MKYVAFLLFAGACMAQTCTPLNYSANPAFPAVVNGIDAVDWAVARFQWTSDANVHPVNAQRIVYATAAQWAANPGVYPQTQGLQGFYATSATTIQGGAVPNLLPSTLYHVAGESSTDGGNTWCPAVDETFTTLAKPANLMPTQPQTFSIARPTITGTDYTYGSTCGTSGTVQARLSNCYSVAQLAPSSTLNNGIGIPPGVYQTLPVNTPDNPNAIAISCTISGSVCTQTGGSVPSAGTLIRLDSPPSPINVGVTYKVFNPVGLTFQVSYDGVSAITFTSNSSSGYVLWPLTQGWIVVHSTASAANLPPVGTGLNQSNLAQYRPYMPEIQALDPYKAVVYHSYFASNYYYENVLFTSDATTGTSSTTCGNCVDPPAFGELLSTSNSNANIIFDQCGIIPAAPPARSKDIGFDGTNIGYVNNLIQGLDYWQPFRQIPATTVTSSSVSVPAGYFYWVGSSGTKQTCTTTGGSLAVSGSANGYLSVWQDPTNCHLTFAKQQLTTGTLTVTPTGMTDASIAAPTATSTCTGTCATNYGYQIVYISAAGINSIASSCGFTGATGAATLNGSNFSTITIPAVGGSTANVYRCLGGATQGYIGNTSGTSFNDTGIAASGSVFEFPTYTYSEPGGGQTAYGWNVLTLGESNITAGGVSGYQERYGLSMVNLEGGVGLHAGSGPGPYRVENNQMVCGGVCGVFMSDDHEDPLAMYQTGNLIERRNHISANPCYFADAGCWNGGDYSWRNLSEQKKCVNCLQDGNVWGPYYGQVAQGDCGLAHLTYTANYPDSGIPVNADSSNWTATNNTCISTGAGAVYTAQNLNASYPSYPFRNAYIHNNLFINNNAYNAVATLVPLQSQITRSNSVISCPYGKGAQWGGNGENFIYDHNTTYGQGGCLTWFWDQFLTLATGITYTNNVLNLVSDPGYYAGNLATGTAYQANATFGGTTDNPNCNGFQASAMFACLNQFTWGGNVILATWTNSFPGSQVDYTNAQISTAQALFPGSTSWPSSGTTLATRLAGIHITDYNGGNYRFNYLSPYISGANASTDGLDIGVDQNALEAAQGKVSNVHTYGATTTSVNVNFLAPDATGCPIDYGTTAFYNGSGTWTRVSNAGGQRVQTVALTGLPADALIYYRVSCAVSQPTGTVQLP